MLKIAYTAFITFLLSVHAPGGNLLALPHSSLLFTDSHEEYPNFEPISSYPAYNYPMYSEYQASPHEEFHVSDGLAGYPVVNVGKSRAYSSSEDNFGNQISTNGQTFKKMPSVSSKSRKFKQAQSIVPPESVAILPSTATENLETADPNFKAPPPNLVAKVPNVKPDFGFVNAKNIDGTLRKITYVADEHNNIVPQSQIDIKNTETNSGLSGLTAPLLSLLK